MEKHKQIFIETLGYELLTSPELEYPVIKIPGDRIRKLRHDIGRCLKSTSVTAKFLVRILCGQCVSISRAIMPGKMRLLNAYRLLRSSDDWRSTLLLDQGTLDDLLWWREASLTWNGRHITNRPVSAQLVTDASSTGFGVYSTINRK